jgi:hypothetical protein
VVQRLVVVLRDSTQLSLVLEQCLGALYFARPKMSVDCTRGGYISSLLTSSRVASARLPLSQLQMAAEGGGG